MNPSSGHGRTTRSRAAPLNGSLEPGADPIRIRLTLHYDGADFHGWQVQPDVPTVQGELEAVAARLTGGHRPVLGAGRTDRGVHALGQVAVLDVPDPWTPAGLRKSLNALLPPGIWVASAERAPEDFHPRYDAVARTYAYRVGLDEASLSPFHRRYCWPLARPLDPAVLHESADLVVGSHTFRAFAKSGQPERGDRCRVLEAEWSDWPPLGMTFRITADRYLHHMVRYLVGTMVEAAQGKRPPEDFRRLLEGGSGADGPITSAPAPAEGLFLTAVRYPRDPECRDGLGERARRPTTNEE